MKKRGLKVLVSETEHTTEHHVYGNPLSVYHELLRLLIESKGGFRDGIQVGTYEFKLERKGFKIYSMLTPWVD